MEIAGVHADSRDAAGHARRGRWSSRVRDYRRNVLLAMGMRLAENGLFYVYTVFVLSYGPGELGLPRNTMLLGRQPGGAGRPGGDSAVRRAVGSSRPQTGVSVRRRVLAAVTPFRSSGCSTRDRRRSSGWRSSLGVTVGHNAMYGPQAAYFSELFGASVRYSGASLGYQLASVLSGGLAPFIATALLAWFGSDAVAAYMVVLSAVTVVAAYLAPETYRSDFGATGKPRQVIRAPDLKVASRPTRKVGPTYEGRPLAAFAPK